MRRKQGFDTNTCLFLGRCNKPYKPEHLRCKSFSDRSSSDLVQSYCALIMSIMDWVSLAAGSHWSLMEYEYGTCSTNDTFVDDTLSKDSQRSRLCRHHIARDGSQPLRSKELHRSQHSVRRRLSFLRHLLLRLSRLFLPFSIQELLLFFTGHAS